jgi:hypothetical protein
MMDKNKQQPFQGKYDDKVFSPEYYPISFYSKNGNQLQAITLAVIKNVGNFTLSVVTAELYLARQEDADDNEKNDIYLLPYDEIFPSHLLDIKEQVFTTENLNDYLTPQSSEGE